MIVLDASVLIALLGEGHPHGPLAAMIMDTEEELMLHPMTFAEILVGAVRSGEEGAVEKAMARIGIGVWSPDDDHPRRLARLRAETGLKMPDCCVLELALSENAELATFDERLARVAESLGVTRNTP